MATSTYTQYGKTVKYGMTELDDALVTSADLTYAKDTKEYTDHTGTVVALVDDLNPRVEASIDVTMLDTTSVSTLETTLKTWLETQATSDTFALSSGGTTIITDIKVSEKNDDAATASVSAVYYPYVVSSE